jgi:hypothetical protein
MAGTPELKIFNPSGEYIGCMKHGEDAACICASYGTGASIRYGHDKRSTVWNEGAEEFSAGESYDRVAKIIDERIAAIWSKAGGKRAVAS